MQTYAPVLTARQPLGLDFNAFDLLMVVVTLNRR